MSKKYNSLSKLLTPDYMFDTFTDVTPEFLSELGIKALLIDIDNTLAPYEQPEPDERIIAWFSALSEHGIKASLISNNHPPRVELFNKNLGLDAYPDSGKPKSATLLIAMKKMGSTPENTAGLGDQLLTDTLSVHRLGMLSIIVPPIKDKTTPFFKTKRLLERPYIRKYRKAHGIVPTENSLSKRTWK
ncbi:MAG: YqeG family HAD IIIA-type phosphatase [Ruminococcaceae bacterium]|nr:YqeG family HAD IIIA-type phosphatase [Oscillospiraceae bacterium]